LQTLFNIVFDAPDGIADKLEGSCAAKIADRKDPFEDPLETLIDPFVGIHFLLEKTLIGLPLHFYEIGDLHYFSDLTEILADSIIIGQ
jgi:hypothetical protein